MSEQAEMTNERFNELLQKYMLQKASDGELDEFFSAVRDERFEGLISEAVDSGIRDMPYGDLADPERKRLLLQKILYQTRLSAGPSIRISRRSPMVRWMAAASVLLVVGTIAYFYFSTDRAAKLKTTQTTSVRDIFSPDSDKAILTLSNGRQIILDEAGNGTLARQGDIVIQRENDGSIVYSGDMAASRTYYNTLTVPRGSRISGITLSDGSRLTLNASSSVTFPAAFTGKERRVEISGEVYFEVVKDTARPFLVKTYSDEIRVLGTVFNVNSYPDEPAVKTSLLEGVVQIGDKRLQPGQAHIAGAVVPTNVEQDLAWINGVFNFENKKLDEVMRLLARWYDLEVIYPNGVPDVEFGGELKRDLTLGQILTALQRSEIHFQLEGHKLIVKP